MSPNQLPWRWEQVRYNDVFVYADMPRAVEGGTCGRFIVYLPSPAPPGGATVKYYFGGSAIRGEEYVTTPVGNALHIPAGLVSGSIDICAVDDRKYADLNRYVQLTITNVTGYTFDTHAATVGVIDNDLPEIRVFAFPPRLARPDPREGTNNGTFFFIRDGDSVTACTIGFSITGTAQSGVDYSPLPNTIDLIGNKEVNDRL
jgi:hypothetical protein